MIPRGPSNEQLWLSINEYLLGTTYMQGNVLATKAAVEEKKDKDPLMLLYYINNNNFH